MVLFCVPRSLVVKSCMTEEFEVDSEIKWNEAQRQGVECTSFSPTLHISDSAFSLKSTNRTEKFSSSVTLQHTFGTIQSA